MNQLKIANMSHAIAVTELRQRAYKSATGFSLNLESLSWQDTDDQSYVLIVEQAGAVVATMRGEVIADRTVLEKKLECPWDFPQDITYPVLLLSRAATDPEIIGKGWNLLMRYWFMQFAKAHKIHFLLGTFVSDSPRENSLRAMGYQFFENKIGWTKSSYKSLRPVHVVCLNINENFNKAEDFVHQTISPLLNEYINSEATYSIKTNLKFVSNV